ncbi:MAG: aldehyde dehydrogenase family protein, partial [Bacteroidales bacterium]
MSFGKYKIRFVHVAASLMMGALLILVFSAYQPSNEKREKVLLESMLKSLSFMHYAPVEFDEKFSNSVFDQYLEVIDFNKRFFLHTDIQQLASHRTQIGNQIRNRELSFFNDVEDLIVKRIKDASSYYGEVLSEPFDFAVDEDIELDPEKSKWCATEKELKEEWRKGLKYQVMLRVHQDLEIQEVAREKQDTLGQTKSFEEIEKAAREQVQKTHADYFDRLLKLTRDDRFGMYLNAIGAVYDPHTNYFPPKLKDDFDIAMSGKLEGIGAVLTQRGGYIQVEEIMPGSPSWKQGELKAGDIILKVAQGEAEPVDVTSMRLDDAVKLIRGKKGTEARLTVKKTTTEEIVIINIVRDVVEMEQTYARSAVITAHGKKIGYIYLPKFYVDFNNPFTGRQIVSEVLKGMSLEAEKPSGTEKIGVFTDINDAINAAEIAFKEYIQLPLDTRTSIIDNIRKVCHEHNETMSKMAHEETGMGRVEDKIAKNILGINKTPGVEDVVPQAFSSEHGLTLVERAPYGIIGSITPSTNSTVTIISNAIGMIAAGNVV